MPAGRSRPLCGRREATALSDAPLKGTAAFLAIPASDCITGQMIFVDGGFSAT